MTRVESNLPSLEGGGEEIQEAIKTEAKKLRPEKQVIKKRPLFSCFNCLAVFLIILAVLIVWFLISLAKTGLADIPFFTGMYYSAPQPIHPVAIKPGEKNNLAQQTDKAVLTASDSGAVQISEKELTALLLDNIKQINASQSQFALESGQVAIEPETAEIFAKFSRPASFYLTIGFKPQLENQKIIFVPQSIKIGNFKLPLVLAQFLFDRFVNNQLSSSLKDLPIILKNVNLNIGKITIDFIIDPNKFKVNVK